jgi:hypothetical protein
MDQSLVSPSPLIEKFKEENKAIQQINYDASYKKNYPILDQKKAPLMEPFFECF